MFSPHAMIAAAGSALSDQLADLLTAVGPLLFYLLVWGLVFAGTGLLLGAFVPFLTGDSLLFGSGVISSTTTSVNPWVLAIGVATAAIAGNQIGYYGGRTLGRAYLENRAKGRLGSILRGVDRFYQRFGWWAVVIARFIPWARVFVPWLAGIARMRPDKFIAANIVGALLWGSGLVTVGYFAASIPAVRGAAYAIAAVMITISIGASIRTAIQTRQEERQRTPRPDPAG